MLSITAVKTKKLLFYKKVIKTLFTLTMFIPVVATQTLIFRMMYAVKLINTMWSVIILYSGVGIVGIYIMLNQLDSISKETNERTASPLRLHAPPQSPSAYPRLQKRLVAGMPGRTFPQARKTGAENHRMEG